MSGRLLLRCAFSSQHCHLMAKRRKYSVQTNPLHFPLIEPFDMKWGLTLNLKISQYRWVLTKVLLPVNTAYDNNLIFDMYWLFCRWDAFDIQSVIFCSVTWSMYPVVFYLMCLVNFYLFLGAMKLKGQLLFCILDISLLHNKKYLVNTFFLVRSSAWPALVASIDW